VPHTNQPSPENQKEEVVPPGGEYLKGDGLSGWHSIHEGTDSVKSSLHRQALIWLWIFSATLSAGAQDTLWKSARAKMLSSDGYAMRYDYEGPEGLYRFHYVVWGDGSRIFTEVLEGSARGAGSRILYDPASDKDNVSLKTHMLTLRRSLKSKDIQGSSLYQPLFRQLVEELAEPEPRQILKAGANTILVFGDKAGSQDRLEVDPQGNPVAMRRLERGKEIKKMTFSNLSWGRASIPWP
jgi:hypothetical protein